MLRLNTFGRLFLTRDGERLSGAAAQPRRLALLALLAASGENGISRDRLLGMLWGETDEERARRGLNQALYALRQEMGSDEVFLGTRDLRINPDHLTSDLALFGAAIKAGRLEQAAEEYAGPFLDGLHLSDAPEFERWVEEERAGLARDYASALERLAGQAKEQGDLPGAAQWWRRLAGQDPLNARVAIALMEALVAAGDRPAALQHARVYEVLLKEELEAPPDRAVVALADRIRRQSASHAAFAHPPAVAPAAAAPSPAPLSPPEPLTILPAISPPAVPVPPAAAPARSRRGALVPVVAALTGAGLAAAAILLLRRTPEQPPVGRMLRITSQPGLEVHPALSPDGGFVAYAAGPTGRLRIFVRQLAGGRTVAVTEGLGGDQHWPRWSPDGSRISFEMGHAIYVVPALGGAAKLLVPAPPQPSLPEADGPGFLAWSPDGERFAYADGRALYVRAVAGGPPTRIVAETQDQPHSLAWSPDGTRLAFVQGNAAFVYARNAIGNIAPSSIWIVPAGGGPPASVTDAAALNTSPVWMPGGRVLRFVSDRDGVRDIYQVEVPPSGSPGPVRRVTTGLLPHTIDVSRDGRVMVYGAFTEYANIWSLPVDPASPAQSTAQPVTSGHQSVEGISISADRRWLAFDSDRGGNQAIYRVPLDGGEPEPLSADSGDDFMPAWSPDGREIAYYGFRHGRRRLFVMPVDGGAATPVVADSGNQRFPDWSPDGRRLVYHSDLTGRFELYLVERDVGGRWGTARQLTRGGGQEARWSPDGSAIVYVNGSGLWIITPDGGPARRLIDSREMPGGATPLLAEWAPDGRRIYFKALDADGVASFWSLPPAGGTPSLLARLDDPGRPSPRAEFASDGVRLYFTISERESDVWRMELGR